jgi:hypothetical protein
MKKETKKIYCKKCKEFYLKEEIITKQEARLVPEIDDYLEQMMEDTFCPEGHLIASHSLGRAYIA